MPQCQRVRVNGEQCRRYAMKGKRTCYLHGGKAGMPPVHGRYSHSLPADLRERYEYFKSDPEILSLKPDVALARTFMERFMGGWEPGQVISAETGSELRQWGETISRIAERCHKILYGERYSITVQGLQAFVAQVADVVGRCIEESGIEREAADRLRVAISAGLADIHGAGNSLEAQAEAGAEG